VSSYLASTLAGTHVAVDYADASGMNLMDIRTLRWLPEALAATAPDLEGKLPPLTPSSSVVGVLSPRWQQQLRLPAIPIVAWSGDNPCSLVGTGLIQEGQLAISLGTSDTIFGPMDEPRVSNDGTGHVFASPLGAYMGMTVFRNGSLARERIRDEFDLTWEGFSAALRATPAGNDGAAMLPWFEPEITPDVPRAGAYRYDLEGASPFHHVRAIVEGQVLAFARHSKWMGVTPRTILATGGGAANREILQVIADAFDAEVFRFEATDSAALGAALRAYQADSGVPWPEVVEGFVSPVVESRVSPIPAHVAIYRQLAPIHAEREAAARLDAFKSG
jgi:xylulokinase